MLEISHQKWEEMANFWDYHCSRSVDPECIPSPLHTRSEIYQLVIMQNSFAFSFKYLVLGHKVINFFNAFCVTYIIFITYEAFFPLSHLQSFLSSGSNRSLPF